MKEVKIKKVKGCKAAVIKEEGPYDKVGPILLEEKLLTEIQVPVKKT